MNEKNRITHFVVVQIPKIYGYLITDQTLSIIKVHYSVIKHVTSDKGELAAVTEIAVIPAVQFC